MARALIIFLLLQAFQSLVHGVLGCQIDTDCNSTQFCLDGGCVCKIGSLTPDCSRPARFQQCNYNNLHCWAWDFDNNYVYVQIYAQTTGWAGLMFGAQGGMINGDCWQVDVDDLTGEVFAIDRFATDYATPSNNEVQNLENPSGWQNATHTVVSFQRKLDTQEAGFDLPIVPGSTTVSWAFGTSDTFEYHYGNRGDEAMITWLPGMCKDDTTCSPSQFCLNSVCVCRIGALTPDCSRSAAFQQCNLNGQHCWTWDYDTNYIYLQMYVQTTGWAGLIFGASGGMVNGDCWQVDVNDTTGVAIAVDRFAVTYDTPSDNEVQNLEQVSGWQNATHTVVSFQRKLDTGEQGLDYVVTGMSTPVSWAFGLTDVFYYHDVNRGDEANVIWLQGKNPSTPAPPVPTAATNNSITLQWSLPTLNGSTPIQNFDLERDNAGDLNFFSVFNGSALSTTVTGLRTSTSYNFRLRVLNQQSASNYSSLVNLTTLPDNYRAPDAPTPPKLVSAESSSIEVEWTQPNLYGAPLLSYLLEYSASMNGTWSVGYNGLATNATVQMLDADVTYLFRLSATTLAGTSPYSNNASYMTSNCLNSCSKQGQCIKGQCQCDSNALGSDCSVSNVFSDCEDGGKWCVVYKTDSENIYVRLALGPPTGTWIGMMLGAAPDGMTNGDTWVVSVDPSTGAVSALDYFSYALGQTPTLDKQQDLKDVVGYILNGTTYVSFRRLLNTGDSMDYVLTNNGEFVRTSWAFGNSLQFTAHSPTNAGTVSINYFSGQSKSTPEVGLSQGYPIAAAFGFCVVVAILLHYTQFGKTGVGEFLQFRRVGRQSSVETWLDDATCNASTSLLDLTYSELILITIYVGTIIAAYFIGYDNFNNSNGKGYLIYGQLALFHLCLTLFIPTRNSIWVYLFGIPFERAIKYHRWIARITISFMIVHGVQMIQKKGTSIITNSDATDHGDGAFYGALAFLCFGSMLVTAFEPVRRRLFEWFYFLHFAFIAGLYFMWFHNFYFRNWVVVPIFLYVIDHVIRFTRTLRQTTLVSARVVGEGDGRITELRLRAPGIKYDPGQYCFIWIPAVSLFQWHPFSFAWTPGLAKVPKSSSFASKLMKRKASYGTRQSIAETGNPEGMPIGQDEIILNILDMGRGTWTRKLADIVSSTEMEYRSPFKIIRVDGPYGKFGVNFEDYPIIVLVAGGVGITPLMAALSYLRREIREKKMSHIVAVHLVWTNRHYHAFTNWFPEILHEINDERSSLFHLHLYWTNRAGRPPRKQIPKSAQSIEPSRPLLESSRSSQSLGDEKNITPSSPSFGPYIEDENNSGLPIESGVRPDFDALFASFSRQAKKPSDVAVLCCGPMPLIDSAQTAAEGRRFHFHKETFFL